LFNSPRPKTRRAAPRCVALSSRLRTVQPHLESLSLIAFFGFPLSAFPQGQKKLFFNG
jgi:hypothetical protein